MKDDNFIDESSPALRIERITSGRRGIASRSSVAVEQPEGNVTVRVEWSTLNYKDKTRRD